MINNKSLVRTFSKNNTNLYSLSVGVIILNANSEILLIKSPRRGWEYPGGQIENDESIEIAAKREVFEETGYRIKIQNFCGIFQNLSQNICCFLFKAKTVSKREFTPNHEALEIDFFSLEEAFKRVKWLNFSDRIKMCLDINSQPFIFSFNEE